MANRISVEFMQLESGHIQILETVGRVERVENVYAALLIQLLLNKGGQLRRRLIILAEDL
jgi:hypothetical protein